MHEHLFDLLSARIGHFLLESGHHGELWLELESLCLRPKAVQPLAAELAQRLSSFDIEAVCGPLVEGAFVALFVAAELDVEFTYSERFAQPSSDGLFPAGYRIPTPLRKQLHGKRVAIVNDVTNAGYAVKGTFADLQVCGANIVAIASLLVLGRAAADFAAERNVALVTLAKRENRLWTPKECPLCHTGLSLQDLGGYAAMRSTEKL